jgi:gamma-polyglutamate synthase
LPNDIAVILLLFGAVTLGLHVEWRRHSRRLAAVPLRIHVNGTRGKSSVTRLIAAILREHGISTLAKTTGSAARLIFPSGAERPVPRNGAPNLREMIWATKQAVAAGAKAVVFECMAVNPDLQWVAEHRILKPTITVVTNARLDHTDVQGTSPEQIAVRFPVRAGGTLVTADPIVATLLEGKVRATGGAIHLADRTLEPSVAAGMPYLEQPENVALALAVADLLGIPRAVALRGLHRCAPDPGVASVMDFEDDLGRWTLVNLFAANDPQSTFLALSSIEARFPDVRHPIVLFASRADRTARSAEFAAALVAEQDRFSQLVIWGEKTRAMARKARAGGLTAQRVVDAGSIEPEALTRLLVGRMDGRRAVVGIGNIIGPAGRWLQHLEGMSV